jgi:signal peptidase I
VAADQQINLPRLTICSLPGTITAMPDAVARPKSETNVKETIESILVAFILAFIFRAFVIEAFVIPTGSMAPTLLGAHMNLRCPDCGYGFDVGYGVSDDPSYRVPEYAAVPMTGEPKIYSLFCPNCGFRLPPELPSDRANDATAPSVRYGDRILVMKYLYLLQNPRRWDVVVFKSPRTDNEDYSVNYIKRLVGLPGERMFLAHGDLYVAPPSDKPREAWTAEEFVVQPKTRWAQDALWRIVFNGDYVPIRLPRSYQDSRRPPRRQDDPAWQPPWQQSSGSGWFHDDPSKNVTAREWLFDNRNSAGALSFNPAANKNASSLTDWLAYDQSEGQGGTADTLLAPPIGASFSVADLKLSFFVNGLEGDGTLRAVVGKESDDGNVAFVAELSANQVRLIKRTAAGEEVIGSQPMSLTGLHHVSLENVDYRVTLRIDDKEVFVTTPQQYKPDIAGVIASVSSSPQGYALFEGDRVQARISHLQLWRDIYYRDRGQRRATINIKEQNGVAAVDFNGVVQLAEEQFFVLGDNSALSADGREWSNDIALEDEGLFTPAGIVPDRFMLGKAFFVYWPAGYRPTEGLPPIVPNFGQMRFIR